MSSIPEPAAAYKKVLKGGLKFKNDKPKAASRPTAPRTPQPGFKVKSEASKRDPLVDAPPAGPAASSSSSSSAASSSIAPPIVLAHPVARSTWGLHKDELHEIDANLKHLREHDRQVERLEGKEKKELVEREKKMIEEQVAARKAAAQQQETQVMDFSGGPGLAPGVKFSVPNASSINKQYLYRQEENVSDATARLDQRVKKKSDRFCK